MDSRPDDDDDKQVGDSFPPPPCSPSVVRKTGLAEGDGRVLAGKSGRSSTDPTREEVLRVKLWYVDVTQLPKGVLCAGGLWSLTLG